MRDELRAASTRAEDIGYSLPQRLFFFSLNGTAHTHRSPVIIHRNIRENSKAYYSLFHPNDLPLSLSCFLCYIYKKEASVSLTAHYYFLLFSLKENN